MKTVLIVSGILAIISALAIWCCIRVGAKADADMYKMFDSQSETKDNN